MATSYYRKFTDDPGLDVLLEIESINVLDLDPEAVTNGVGSGAVCVVGEFEDGEYRKTVEVTSVGDVLKKYGSLGYTYGGQRGNYPSAFTRSADDSITPEYWNGNGHVAINGKRFARLMICRVDTSTGDAYFSPLAFVTGAAAFRYILATGKTLTFEYDSTPVTATFTAAKATVTGSGGTFPSSFAGGESLVLGYDGADDFTVVFLSTDQSVAQVVARINTYAGFTFAEVSSGQIKLTGRISGTDGEVRVVSGSTGVLATLGLTAADTAGTGNVANIAAVTVEEINTIVDTATSSDCVVKQDNAGRLRLINVATPLTGTLQITGGTATSLGFTTTKQAVKAGANAGVLPAGTRLKTSGDAYFVTTQSTTIVAGQQTAYKVRIRHAVDDGTGTAKTAGTINVLYDRPDVGEFAVANLNTVSAAMTEAQIDAAYAEALEYTKGLNGITREINILVCARQSNTVRNLVKSNVQDASSTGHVGRVGVIRAPMGSDKSDVIDSTTTWGVVATRSDRIIYCYPQFRAYVPIIAARGIAGGTGFTADGIIDSGADAFMAGLLSQLPPEENPGQSTPYLDGVRGLESATSNMLLDINDYKNFKAAGIAAPRIDNGQVFFQSGVTSVDKTLYPGRVTIARRRMSDYIQDTMADMSQPYSKKTKTTSRKVALISDLKTFLNGLADPVNQRIEGFTMDVKSGNSKSSEGRGLYRVNIKVRTLSSFESIVIATEIGEQVTISEAA